MLRQFSPIPLASNSLGSPEGSLRRAAAIGVLLLFASFWILGGVAVASAAPRDQGPEVIVKLRAPGTAGRTQDGAFRLGTPEVDRVLGRYQAQAVTPAFPGGRPETQEIRRRYGLDRYYKIRLRPGADARAAAAEMRRAPEVELATAGEGARLDADASTAATAEVLPDDPSFGIQWGLRNTGADIGLAMPFEADADIDATEAWDLTTGSSSVTVALIGTGIDYAEPELAGRFFENAAEASGFPGFDDDSNGFIDDTHGWDWIEGDANPGHLPDDPLNLNQAAIDLGATRVASVIGAQGNNAVGMSGIDWGCRILALRLTSGSYFASYSDLMNSYLYAAELGARVIVTSIVTYDLLAEELTMQRDVMAAAQAMGAVVVAPIGTSTVDGVNPIYYPAPLPGVLGVATSQGEDLHCDTGRCAHWSIAGPHVALAAPGRRILTINPVAGAPSTLLLNSGGGFAAAHVAGTAALALSANPALTSEQLSSILKYSADDQVGDPAEDVPGWDPLHGFGRLNSRRAVEWATASPVDLSPPGVISIAPAALTAAENSGAATLTLSRTGGSHGSVSVSWGTADGTAQNGVDYGNNFTPEQLVVTWADGDATDKSISVPLIDNALVDGDRAFTVGLAGPTGGASIAVGASESIVTIADDDNPPAAIDPIGDVDTSEGVTVTVPVHASDAEGDAVSLTAQLPAFGVLNAPLSGAGDLTTTITLTPGYADAGSHFALVQEAGGASEPFSITVSNVDRAPAVTAPASVSGYESVAIAFTVAAGDPDGEAVTNLATTALPLGATFTPAADNSSGDFAWTPAVGQAGPYSVTFQATAGAGALTGSATTAITVSPQNLPPVVVAPASLSSPAGITINFAVTATDPEGEVIERLVMSGLTKGSTFTTSGVGTPTATGTFTWTPPSAQTRTFTFTASNGCGTLPCLFNGSASTVITVTAGVPTLSLSLSNYTVNEAAGTATITVTRGVSSVGTVT
ncbi:MAG TPA: S8 family serine peptidase, partial [Candidatus Eisenbacteria bacterium]|nr:S8 family serine peptidase [Candidatus Eisenbacteria bacterium]